MAVGQGTGGPEIPVLKKKDEKEEKKGTGLVVGRGGGGGGGFLQRWLGLGARSGGALPAAQTAVRVGAAAPEAGLIPRLINFFSSNLGLALMTAALSGLAFYGFYAFNLASGSGSGAGRSVFPVRDSSSTVGPSDGKSGGQDSVGYFASANKGGLGSEEKPETKEVPSPIPAAKAEAKPAPVPELPKIAQALTEKPKMVSAPGFGNARTVGGGGGAGPAANAPATLGSKSGTPAPSKLNDFGQGKGGGVKSLNRRLVAASPQRTLDQLRFTASQSLKANGTSMAEDSSAKATNAFEGGLGQSGNAPAMGIGYGGAGKAPDPNAEGGPLSSAGSLGQTSPPPVGQSSDKSPWTGALMMGVALLAMASIIIMIDALVAQQAKQLMEVNPPQAQQMQALAAVLAAIAAAMAAAAAVIGAMIMQQHGQQMQGMILVVGGTITTIAAIASLIVPPEAAPIVMVLAGIIGIAAAIGAALAAAMNNGNNNNNSSNSSNSTASNVANQNPGNFRGP